MPKQVGTLIQATYVQGMGIEALRVIEEVHTEGQEDNRGNSNDDDFDTLNQYSKT